jgi:hypothetical protein
MLRYYMDHNVQEAITVALRARGIDCLSCEEDGMTQSDDADILQRATDLDRVVFSEDRDFLKIASAWMRRGREFGGVVFGKQLEITIGGATRDLELIAVAMSQDEIRSQIVYIPL